MTRDGIPGFLLDRLELPGYSLVVKMNNTERETEMKTKTYKNGTYTINVLAGKVVASDVPASAAPGTQVGEKVNMDFVRRAGLRLQKDPTRFDAWGRKIG